MLWRTTFTYLVLQLGELGQLRADQTQLSLQLTLAHTSFGSLTTGWPRATWTSYMEDGFHEGTFQEDKPHMQIFIKPLQASHLLITHPEQVTRPSPRARGSGHSRARSPGRVALGPRIQQSAITSNI